MAEDRQRGSLKDKKLEIADSIIRELKNTSMTSSTHLRLNSKNIVSKTSVLLTIIFFTTLLARIAYLYLSPSLSIAPDTINSYTPIALNLILGNGYSIQPGIPTDKILPLYPLFLACIYSIFGCDYFIVRLILAIIDSLTVVVSFLIANRLFSRKVAFFSSLAISLYLPFVHLFTYALSDNLFILLISLFTYFFIKTFEDTYNGNSIKCGFFLGLAILCKPIPCILPVFAVMGWLFLYYKNFKLVIIRGILLLITLSFFIGPWSLRNYTIFHEFTPLVSGIVEGLIMYTYDEQLKSSPNNERFKEFDNKEEVRAIKSLEGIDRRILARKTLFNRFIESPVIFLKLMGVKFLRFWYASDSGKFDNVLVFLQFPILVFGILGIIAFCILDNWKRVFPIALVILYFVLTHSFASGFARYSMPIMPYIIMFATYGIFNFLNGKFVLLNRKGFNE